MWCVTKKDRKKSGKVESREGPERHAATAGLYDKYCPSVQNDTTIS
jgi:hypothetical protein